MAQNFEKRVLQKCLRIDFYTYIPVNLHHFLKKPHNHCTLTDIQPIQARILLLHEASRNMERTTKLSVYGSVCVSLN
jgi:hypothetical protein